MPKIMKIHVVDLLMKIETMNHFHCLSCEKSLSHQQLNSTVIVSQCVCVFVRVSASFIVERHGMQCSFSSAASFNQICIHFIRASTLINSVGQPHCDISNCYYACAPTDFRFLRTLLSLEGELGGGILNVGDGKQTGVGLDHAHQSPPLRPGNSSLSSFATEKQENRSHLSACAKMA